jgi:hypothetical protein
MKWRMFHIPAGESTRHYKGIIRLHYMVDAGSSAGFVEQTQVREGMDINVLPKFHVHMNTNAAYIANPDGVEVPDLEAGMALVKILYNPSND